MLAKSRHKIFVNFLKEENRDQMIKMPVEIFPECPYPADVHYVDLPEVYKARVHQTFFAIKSTKIILIPAC